MFSVLGDPTKIEMSGKLIAYLSVSTSERPGWSSGSASIFVMKAADVWEGDDSTLVW